LDTIGVISLKLEKCGSMVVGVNRGWCNGKMPILGDLMMQTPESLKSEYTYWTIVGVCRYVACG